MSPLSSILYDCIRLDVATDRLRVAIAARNDRPAQPVITKKANTLYSVRRVKK